LTFLPATILQIGTYQEFPGEKTTLTASFSGLLTLSGTPGQG
jgi:hypothetical protein